jgi:hypothetical protein
MKAYDEIYLPDIIELQGNMFLNIREALPSVDEKWFIENWMCSRIRGLLDHANPKFAAMPSWELIQYYAEEEWDGNYKRGNEWGGFLPQWVGMVYSMYQWKFNTPSEKLIKLLPLEKMESMFPTLHQTGLETAIDKIHSITNPAY